MGFPEGELSRQAFFAGRFQQAGTEEPVDFNGRTKDLLG